MKIYFAGSIRGGRDDIELYITLVEHLSTFGEVLTEPVSDKGVTAFGESKLSDIDIHARDMVWLDSCDVVVAEVTTPSLGVGYEIGRALEKGKKVICLYRELEGKRISAMISGCEEIERYSYDTAENAKEILDKLFSD